MNMIKIAFLHVFAFMTVIFTFWTPAIAQQNTNPPAAASSSAPAPKNWGTPAFPIPGTEGDAMSTSYRDADPLKNPIFQKLSKDMQEELLGEAGKFRDECALNTTYAQKHNCDCLSLHYINERLKIGPDKSGDMINQDIMLDCVDTASTAGFAYDKCINLYSQMYPDHTKDLCECFARSFAKRYAKKPAANPDYERMLSMQAITECRPITQGNGAAIQYDNVTPAPSSPGDLLNLKP